MRMHLGMALLGRCALLAAFVMAISCVFIVFRSALQGQMVSWSMLVTFAQLQLPHVAYLAVSLATYWTVDEWWRSGKLELFAATGVRSRRVVWALLSPLVVLSALMLAYNLTWFRRASIDLPMMRAVTELASAPEGLQRKGVLRLGAFRLIGARASHDHELQEVLVSFAGTVLEAPRARISPTSLLLEDASVTTLSPLGAGTVRRAEITLPASSPLSWRHHLRRTPAGTARAAAFGLDVLALALAAVACATRGSRGSRLVWMALWCGAAVAPVLVVQNTLVDNLPRGLHPGLLFIPAVPVLCAVVWGVVWWRSWWPRQGGR